MTPSLARRIPAATALGVALLLPAVILVGCQEEAPAPTAQRAPQPPAVPPAPTGSQAPVVPANPATVQGHLDAVNAQFIMGWALDTTKPTNPVSVDVFDGDTLLASVAARDFRKDLLAAGKGDGNHAFRVPVPDKLKDGKPHAIHAKCAGVVLHGSPKTFPGS